MVNGKMTKKIIQLKNKDMVSLREELIKKQKNVCPLCERKINSPVIDHQHKKRIKGSGLLRGVLCRSCNVMLGKVENNCVRYSISQNELPAYLRNMANYLEKEHLPYIHPSEAPKVKRLKKSSYKRLVKIVNGKQKVPDYPKSGKLTKPLKELYTKYGVQPKYYA